MHSVNANPAPAPSAVLYTERANWTCPNAATATEIYDKTVNVYDSFVQANQSIDKAKTKMEEAKLRLQDGPGSLTKKVQKMKKLGRLNTKKELPDDLEDDIN